MNKSIIRIIILIQLIFTSNAYTSIHFGIPKSSKPAANISVLNVRAMTPADRLLAASIQGLMNKKIPRIYLDSADSDIFWLEFMKSEGHIKTIITFQSIGDLISKYRSEIKGLVITDPDFPLSNNIATMIASVENCVIADPETAKKLNLPVKYDLRKKWTTEDEAYSWAYNNLWPRMYPKALCWADPNELYNLERDYLIQHKIWTLWIGGKIDGSKSGSYVDTQKKWTTKIMRETPGNIPIFGFPYNGEGIGIGEMGGTTLASYYGKYNVCTSLNPNLSFHSGFPPLKLQIKKPIKPKFDLSKIYISFILSDGDNLLTFNGSHLPLWNQNPQNRPPISWSIGPASGILMPEIIKWYDKTMKPGDTFITDVSGAGYMYPAIYGGKLNESDVLDDYAKLTSTLSNRLGINTLALHDYMGTLPKHIETFARNWNSLKCVFMDYMRVSGMDQAKSLYKLHSGTVVIHSGIKFNISDDREERISSAVNDIKEMSVKTPAFINGFMVNWVTDPNECAEIMNRLGDKYVAVSPDVLAEFASQYAFEWKSDGNIALDAIVTSPDSLSPDLDIDEESNDRNACDGSESTYWDEIDGADRYVISLEFKKLVSPKSIEIVGFAHENFAPKTFDIILDGKIIKTISNLQYADNRARIEIPKSKCRKIELNITEYYGGSPAIRELKVFE